MDSAQTRTHSHRAGRALIHCRFAIKHFKLGRNCSAAFPTVISQTRSSAPYLEDDDHGEEEING